MAFGHIDAAPIAALRVRIAAIERQGQPHADAAVLPFDVPTIDRHLPSGGLLLGAMHELQAAGPDVEYGAAPALFAAGILARHPGSVVWIGRRHGVFGHGLLRAGLDLRRIVFVDAGKTGLSRCWWCCLRARGPARAGGLAPAATRRRRLPGTRPADPPQPSLRRSRPEPALGGHHALAGLDAAICTGPSACAGRAGPEPAALAARADALPRRPAEILDRGES